MAKNLGGMAADKERGVILKILNEIVANGPVRDQTVIDELSDSTYGTFEKLLNNFENLKDIKPVDIRKELREYGISESELSSILADTMTPQTNTDLVKSKNDIEARFVDLTKLIKKHSPLENTKSTIENDIDASTENTINESPTINYESVLNNVMELDGSKGELESNGVKVSDSGIDFTGLSAEMKTKENTEAILQTLRNTNATLVQKMDSLQSDKDKALGNAKGVDERKMIIKAFNNKAGEIAKSQENLTNSISSLYESVQGTEGATANFRDTVMETANTMSNNEKIMSTSGNEVDGLFGKVTKGFSTSGDALGKQMQNTKQAFGDMTSGIGEFTDAMDDGAGQVFNDLNRHLGNTTKALSGFRDGLMVGLGGLFAAVASSAAMVFKKYTDDLAIGRDMGGGNADFSRSIADSMREIEVNTLMDPKEIKSLSDSLSKDFGISLSTNQKEVEKAALRNRLSERVMGKEYAEAQYEALGELKNSISASSPSAMLDKLADKTSTLAKTMGISNKYALDQIKSIKQNTEALTEGLDAGTTEAMEEGIAQMRSAMKAQGFSDKYIEATEKKAVDHMGTSDGRKESMQQQVLLMGNQETLKKLEEALQTQAGVSAEQLMSMQVAFDNADGNVDIAAQSMGMTSEEFAAKYGKAMVAKENVQTLIASDYANKMNDESLSSDERDKASQFVRQLAQTNIKGNSEARNITKKYKGVDNTTKAGAAGSKTFEINKKSVGAKNDLEKIMISLGAKDAESRNKMLAELQKTMKMSASEKEAFESNKKESLENALASFTDEQLKTAGVTRDQLKNLDSKQLTEVFKKGGGADSKLKDIESSSWAASMGDTLKKTVTDLKNGKDAKIQLKDGTTKKVSAKEFKDKAGTDEKLAQSKKELNSDPAENAMDEFKKKMLEVNQMLMKKVIPAINKIATNLIESGAFEKLGKAIDWIANNLETVGYIFAALMISKIIPSLIGFGSNLLGAGKGLLGFGKKAFDFLGFGKKAASTVGDTAGAVTKGGPGLLSKAGTSLINGVKGIGKGFWDAGQKLNNAVLGIGKGAIGAGKGLFNGLKGIPGLFGSMGGGVKSTGGVLSKMGGGVKSAGGAAMKGVTGAKDMIANIFKAGKGGATNLVSAFTNAAKGGISGLMGGVKTLGGAGLKGITALGSSIMGGLGPVLSGAAKFAGPLALVATAALAAKGAYDGWNNASEVFKTKAVDNEAAAIRLGAAVDENGRAMTNSEGQFIDASGNVIRESATFSQKVSSAMGGVVESLTFGLVSADASAKWFDKTFGDTWTQIKGVWDGLLVWFTTLWNDMKAIFAPVIENIKKVFDDIINVVISPFKAVMAILTGDFDGFVTNIGVFVGSIGSLFTSIPKLLWSAVTSVWDWIVNFGERLSYKFSDMMDYLSDWWDEFSFMDDVIQPIVDKFVEGFITLSNWWSNFSFYDIVIKPIVDTIGNAFGGMVDKILQYIPDFMLSDDLKKKKADGKKKEEDEAKTSAIKEGRTGEDLIKQLADLDLGDTAGMMYGDNANIKQEALDVISDKQLKSLLSVKDMSKESLQMINKEIAARSSGSKKQITKVGGTEVKLDPKSLASLPGKTNKKGKTDITDFSKFEKMTSTEIQKFIQSNKKSLSKESKEKLKLMRDDSTRLTDIGMKAQKKAAKIKKENDQSTTEIFKNAKQVGENTVNKASNIKDTVVEKTAPAIDTVKETVGIMYENTSTLVQGQIDAFKSSEFGSALSNSLKGMSDTMSPYLSKSNDIASKGFGQLTMLLSNIKNSEFVQNGIDIASDWGNNIKNVVDKSFKSTGDFLSDVNASIMKEETGTANGRYGAAKDIGDGAGISFGAHQLTEKSGGVKKYLKSMAKSGDGEASKMLEKMKGNYFKGDKSELIKYLKKSGNTEDGKKAQDKIYNKEYRDPALKLAEKNGITDKAAIAQIIDHTVNAGVGGAGRMLEKRTGNSADDIANARHKDYSGLKNYDKWGKVWDGRIKRTQTRMAKYEGQDINSPDKPTQNTMVASKDNLKDSSKISIEPTKESGEMITLLSNIDKSNTSIEDLTKDTTKLQEMGIDTEGMTPNDIKQAMNDISNGVSVDSINSNKNTTMLASNNNQTYMDLTGGKQPANMASGGETGSVVDTILSAWTGIKGAVGVYHPDEYVVNSKQLDDVKKVKPPKEEQKKSLDIGNLISEKVSSVTNSVSDLFNSNSSSNKMDEIKSKDSQKSSIKEQRKIADETVKKQTKDGIDDKQATTMVDTLKSMAKKLNDTTGGIYGKAAGGTAAVGSAYFGGGMDIGKSVIDGITGVLKGDMNISDALGNIGGTAKEALGNLGSTVKNLLPNSIQDSIGKVGGLVSKGLGATGKVGGSIKNNISGVLSGDINPMDALKNVGQTIVGQLPGKITGALKGVTDKLGATGSSITNNLQGVLTGKTSIGDALSNVGGTLKQQFTGDFTKSLSNSISSVTGKLGNAGSAISTNISNVLNGETSIGSALTNIGGSVQTELLGPLTNNLSSTFSKLTGEEGLGGVFNSFTGEGGALDSVMDSFAGGGEGTLGKSFEAIAGEKGPLGSALGGIGKSISGAMSGITSSLGSAFSGLFGGDSKDGGGGVVSGALDAGKSLLGSFFAEGGATEKGKINIVGENGPEIDLGGNNIMSPDSLIEAVMKFGPEKLGFTPSSGLDISAKKPDIASKSASGLSNSVGTSGSIPSKARNVSMGASSQSVSNSTTTNTTETTTAVSMANVEKLLTEMLAVNNKQLNHLGVSSKEATKQNQIAQKSFKKSVDTSDVHRQQVISKF